MKRRIGVVLLMLGISIAGLASFTPASHVGAQEQLQPLVITKTLNDQSPTVQQGDVVRYDIKICNPNGVRVDPSTISDTLPVGFTYDADSTSGDTSSGEPAIAGDPQTLTWQPDSSIGANSCAHLFFTAHVSQDEPLGVYCNDASVASQAGTSDTGLTAPVQVTQFVVTAIQQLTCAQPTATSTPVQIVRQATSTPVPPTATPRPKPPTPVSTVLGIQATPKPAPTQQPVVAALPSTGSGGGANGTHAWLLAIAGIAVVAGTGLVLAGRKRA